MLELGLQAAHIICGVADRHLKLISGDPGSLLACSHDVVTVNANTEQTQVMQVAITGHRSQHFLAAQLP